MPADTPALNPRKLAYTFDEARVATTFSRAWFYKMEKEGHIPPLIRVSSKTLIPVEVIDAIVNGKLGLKDGHRCQHWRVRKPSPKRRAGRPRKPNTEAPADAAE